MDECKTVTEDMLASSSDALYLKQIEDVSQMRTSLLLCNKNDSSSVRKALKNVTVLRVYHQIARIIRFTDMLNKIEDKMYESIECTLQDADPAQPTTWSMLMRMQQTLQQTMIDSHKLLEPYLNSDLFESIQVEDSSDPQSFATMMLDQDGRNKLRESAQAVLAALQQSPEEQ